MTELSIPQKIIAIQHRLLELELDAFIFLTTDAHQSEYLAPHWKAREWLSGFTGSAGTLVVTKNEAGLWTDSRYFIQAAQELEGTGIQLFKVKSRKREYDDWLLAQVPKGGKIGVDSDGIALKLFAQFERKLASKEIQLVAVEHFLQPIWTDRPTLPMDMVFEHPAEFVSRSAAEKINQLRAQMQQNVVDWLLISALDEVAWVLNLRGSDVDNNPIFYSYLLIGRTSTHLFVHPQKLSSAIQRNLETLQIEIQPYPQLPIFVAQLPQHAFLQFDPATVSYHLFDRITAQTKEKFSPVKQQKAIKTPAELAHIRTAMRKDGVALVRLFKWLEETTATTTVYEHEVATKLKQFRSQQEHYFGESFDAIVGYGANGAIVHYRPDVKTSAAITTDNLLLLDSGGQYFDGTTDITRTVHLGQPTPQQINDFTMVLKAHIALASCKFPARTRGIQLDAITRQALWNARLDFGHGTGHGVGYFLNVHESPPSISPSQNAMAALEIGMLVSNEPGLYRTGQYGIRIENLIVVQADQENEFGNFYRFETLSLFPIDLNLVDWQLLTPEEKHWLQTYHQTVFQALRPILDTSEQAWLQQKLKLE